MKKLIGIIFFIAGLTGSLIFGLDAYQNTESVKIFGSQITLSQANWTPFIVSAVVMVFGIILIVSGKPASGKKRRR